MKCIAIFNGLILGGAFSFLIIKPGWANEPPIDHVAQNLNIVKITEVSLKPTPAGLEVILTSQQSTPLIPQTRTEGTIVIAELENALLALPEGKAFQALNPTTGIASVTVIQLNPTTVEVKVVGTDTLPVATIQVAEAIASSPLPSTEPSPQKEIEADAEEGIEEELVVRGDRPGSAYLAPNASTATRTDTPIQDTPASIQVVPQQVIQDQQVTRLEEALRNVSGVTFIGNDDGRGASFRLRGFGPGGSEGSGTTLLRDGLRIYGNQGLPEVANLEQIEVLKGPASILYGEVEPGGVINLVSKKPLDKPFYSAELQVGSYSLVRPRLDFSGPLTDDGKLLYRLNALYQFNDSFRDYDTESNRFAIAPTLTWKISDRTQLSASVEYTHDQRPADFGLTAFGNRVVNVPRSRITNNPDDTIENNYLSVGYSFEHQFDDQWTLRNAFRYFSSRYNYSPLALPFTIDDTTGQLTRFFADQESKTQTYSLQTTGIGKFKTGSIKHTLVVGLDLSKTEARNRTNFGETPDIIDIFNPTYGPEPDPATLPVLFDSEDTTLRLGVYAQDQIELRDNLFILAGIRYDTVDQTVINQPTNFEPGSRNTQNPDAFTPRFGIVYKPISQVSLYSSYSQSFVPNTGINATGDLLKPERGQGYEVGIKAELLKGKLFTTLAYFDITKRNVAVADPINFGASIATGKQRSQGVELDVSGEILPGWNVIGAWTYTDAEITKDTDLALVGSKLPNTPEHAASLWTTYELQKGDLKGLGFGLGFNFVGSRQGDLPNSFTADSYFVTNAALFYRRDNWRLGLNFKNLFDVNYIESVGSFRTRGTYPGEPFTVLGSLTIEF
jgi:iron complex outermembrane recepter protein